MATDAAVAPAAPSYAPRRPLRNLSEARHFFRTDLLGLDRWVRNFTYVTYYDAWDGVRAQVSGVR